MTTHVVIAILVFLLAVAIFLWFTKPTAVQIIPATAKGTCDCSNQIDEAYDLGYVDGFNLTTVDADDTKETFYDYETSKSKKSKKDENTAGKGVKYQEKTGGPIVKAVGGLCPKGTQEITSGKNKGKCSRTAEWYKTYRGKTKDGKAFTCTGGRVSNGTQCICDEASGKKWNGKKCMCTGDYSWDSKTKRCIKKGQFKDLLNKMPKSGSKPASHSCPKWQKWDGSKCVCDYANGLNWDPTRNECVCDTKKGYNWNAKTGKCDLWKLVGPSK
ncbi:hypothetical protein ATCVCanal1_500L [Acanthocystis turfacea Chlorella virus Canal-1]|nr:hypothetical protein ATCVCanal1_500L [Acanthocystis turfacea Chlorella virus Canal-1]